MLREALLAIEHSPAASFVFWRRARRCYHNGAARAAFPLALGDSGSTQARATPFVRELVGSIERNPESERARTLVLGDSGFVAVPLFDHEGAIEGTLLRAGTLEDVPSLYREMQTDASLVAQLAHLVPVLVFTVRPNGDRDFVNRPFVDYAGLAIHRWQNGDFAGIVHPDDVALFPAPWNDPNGDRDLFTAEVRLRRRDETYRLHALRLQAIRSRLGGVVKWIGTLLDIEARRLAEATIVDTNAQLDARVEELERVLDVVPVGIAIANGFLSDEIRLNRSLMAILGETAAVVPYGHRAFRYLRGVDLEQIDAAPGGDEIEVACADGSLRHVVVTVAPTKGVDGNGGVVAAFVDVSDRRAEATRRDVLLAAHRGVSLAVTIDEMTAAIVRACEPFAGTCTFVAAAASIESAALADGGRQLVVPCVAAGRTVATFVLHRDAGEPPFVEGDASAFGEFGAAAGIAIDRIRLIERERTIATRLSGLLLPASSVRVNSIDVSVAYRVADRTSPLGADWYDTFSLSGAYVGLSVGAVSGSGVDAAIVAYGLRQRMRDAAFAGASPAAVVFAANAALVESGEDRTASAGFAIVRAGERDVRYALAGLPPPIYVTSEGAHDLEAGGQPLGTSTRPNVYEAGRDIGGATLLALYTGGLTSLRDDGVAGVARFRSALANCSRDDGDVAEAVMRSIARDDVTPVDAALVVARFHEVAG